MSSGDAERQRQRLYLLRLHQAETHNRAAARHEAAAASFRQFDQFDIAERERALAFQERQKAAYARRRQTTSFVIRKRRSHFSLRRR